MTVTRTLIQVSKRPHEVTTGERPCRHAEKRTPKADRL